MNKKQKNIKKVDVLNAEVKGQEKFSKKQKKKNKKLQKQKQYKQNATLQIDEQQQILQQNQQISAQNQELISISSDGNEQIEYFNNDIQFDPKGMQGFDDLMNDNDNNSDNKSFKLLKFKRNYNNQMCDFYLYQIKSNSYYKVTSINHDKLNLTHLNEIVELEICSELLNQLTKKKYQANFLVNGRILEQKFQFMKSSVFKVIPKEIQNQKISNKKKIQLQNIIQRLINHQSDEDKTNIIDFVRDFDYNEQTLLISKDQLYFVETNQPFSKLDQKMLKTNNSLIIVGKKNSGKSTLAEYIKNLNPKQICILDCDIGRSLTVSGCVSLLTPEGNTNIWIGQFTPFNCIINYIKAIESLYIKYRQKYFTKKLIINTMGYLNGLGQMIIYEIYHLINPSEIIVLNLNGQHSKEIADLNLMNILRNIQTGNYMTKLLSQSINLGLKIHKKTSALNIHHLDNEHAQSKGIPIRFQNLLYKKSIKSIVELIHLIKRRQLQKVINLDIKVQDKLGNIKQFDSQSQFQWSNMRLVLICKQYQENFNSTEVVQSQSNEAIGLFQVLGVGFGYQRQIYYCKQSIQKVIFGSFQQKDYNGKLVGLMTEGVDFEKNFYQINQRTLIELQLQYGPIPFILPIIKGIGSKGVRNNPSKNN